MIVIYATFVIISANGSGNDPRPEGVGVYGLIILFPIQVDADDRQIAYTVASRRLIPMKQMPFSVTLY